MTRKGLKDSSGSRTLRINMTLSGSLVDFANEMRQNGHARSIPDLVTQALRVFQDQWTARELARIRLDSIKGRVDTE